MSLKDEAVRVFDLEIEALARTRDSLDGSFEDIVRVFGACRGKVVTTGLGKSGHVARKIASTLSSLGTPAFFLNPDEALHGDLGAVTADDVVLVISHSGESDELKTMLPAFRQRGAVVTAITGRGESYLARTADVTAVLPQFGEACRLGLAPTSSTTAVLCYGDAIAVALSAQRGFTADEFSRIHPAGTLGKNNRR